MRITPIALMLLVALMVISTVTAIHDVSYGGYSGIAGRERRQYDPFSREQYFGEGYQKEFVNYGSKGPTYRVTRTGQKSGFSSVFNLDTNAFSNRGRDPSKISNFDSRMRGYPRIDVIVDLRPFSPVSAQFAGDAALAKGTARVLSVGNAYGTVTNEKYPKTQVFIQTQFMPPIGEEEIYEVWLFDEETEYSLSIGLMKIGNELTGQLFFEFPRIVEEFDAVMITKEAFPDLDPTPNEIVLWGDIRPSRESESKISANIDRLR